MRGGGSGDQGAPFGAGRGKRERRGGPRRLEKGGSPWDAEQTCCQGFMETILSTKRVLAIPSFVHGSSPSFVPHVPLVLKVRSDPVPGALSAEKRWISMLMRSVFIVTWFCVPVPLSTVFLF